MTSEKRAPGKGRGVKLILISELERFAATSEGVETDSGEEDTDD